MPLNAITIARPAPEFEEQHKRNFLPRTLLGGTAAMREARQRFLPKMSAESDDEYNARLENAVLLNILRGTLNSLAGQVFQKPVQYQAGVEGEATVYDQEFFDAFKEDVDTQGNNLSMFTEKLFREGVTDGIAFVLTDYSNVVLQRTESGQLLYQAADGQWRPKTAKADKENGWRPYFVLIPSGQVLDAWLDVVDGKASLRVFRYREIAQRENDDGTRRDIERVRVFYPDRWEVWENDGAKTEFTLIQDGVNSLGVVPVDWFMPGELVKGLTADPALNDLAHMNVAHWRSYADHTDLMLWVRRPTWKATDLKNNDGEPLPFGPGRLIDGNEGSDLKSVGVDPGSVAHSSADLKAKEEYMAIYGLQPITQQTGTMTATQASIAAASSDSTLKGWVQLLQDCMENALKKVAIWMGGADGPALFINNEFRLAYDPSYIAQLSAQADRGQLSVRTLLETEKRMGMFDDDFNVEEELQRIAEEKKQKDANLPAGFGSLIDGM